MFGVAQAEVLKWAGSDDEGEPELFEVYPENWQVIEVFMSMTSQWRWSGGMASTRVGFDYGALDMPFSLAGVKKKDRNRVFRDLKTMEYAALEVWREQQKEAARK